LYITTQAQRDAIAHGTAQIFKQIYEAEFKEQFPNEADFYAKQLYFITATFNPEHVSLTDRIGFSTRRCIYQDLIDQRVRDPRDLASKSHSELVSFAKQHELGLDEPDKLSREELLWGIHFWIDEPNLQRPLIANRPKPHPLKCIEHLHHIIAEACVGANLKRKRHLQPLLIAYVDFEGTRRGSYVDPTTSTWPHVHGIMFVRPEHNERFHQIRSELLAYFRQSDDQATLDRFLRLEAERSLTASEQSKRLALVKQLRKPSTMRLTGDANLIHGPLHIDPYDPTYPLAWLIGYSSKGADKVGAFKVQKDNRWRDAEFAGAANLVGIFPRRGG
jgi:hypothetical protein